MVGRFQSELVLRDRDGVEWIVDQPLIFQRACGDLICVPPGFVTDLASVPRVFWRLVPRSGTYNEAAVVHDWLYVTRRIGQRYIGRGEADAVLQEGMEALGCWWLTRKVIYWAVRLAGWVAWMRRSREEI